MATTTDAHLLLLGAGGEYRNVETQLQQLAQKLSVTGSVHFLGHQERIKDYLLAAAVFVLPTSAEGMSNALVEAFACGNAIIATDIEANREICVDGENSLLVPVRDVDSLHKTLLCLLTDRALAERLGKAARAKAESSLTLDAMITDYLQTYQEAIQANR